MSIRIPHGLAQHWPDFIVKAIASVAVTAHMYSVLSFPIFFVYRLFILTNNVAYGHYFNKRNMLFTFVVIFLMSAMEGSFFFFANVDYESLFEKLNRTSNALDQFKEQPVTHLQVLYTTTQNPASQNGAVMGVNGQMQTVNDIAMQEAVKSLQKRVTIFGDDFSRNPIVTLFLAIALGGHLLAYIVVLLCAHLMLKALQRKSGQISFQARMSHEVLVHAIFAEAFIPLTFTVPILANSILCFIYTDSLAWQEFLPEYLIAIVPLLTPILSILFIKPYRHVALNYLTFGLREKQFNSFDSPGTFKLVFTTNFLRLVFGTSSGSTFLKRPTILPKVFTLPH
ncbi:unnamed protein product, partial [Mesorhabditis belari]|uniref:G protein-coupled receptor n=1 Tax=Mesorhabditis belari TaxID=2138241 RepID=A0AAF3EBV6_9BILA